jgi:crotonobetainyl-CoA:carnitine CoA-transferase CaiB-like acyl-CoA transferase
MLRTVEQPGVGEMRVVAPPWRFADTPAEIRLPAPRLGEHTAEVLGELGIGVPS